jgi:hypothetical protein
VNPTWSSRPALLFAFFWRCIPAAILAALAGSSVSRIGGMIIAANGFCFFLPKQKEGPRQGLAESSF